jgi:hypothetical protein
VELLPQQKAVKERDVIIGKDGKEKELLLESAENLSKAEKELLAKADAAEEDDDDGVEGKFWASNRPTITKSRAIKSAIFYAQALN